MAKGMVVIAVDRCKGCGLCTHVCPANILAFDNTVFNAKGYHPVSVTDPEQCIGCASCARICPDVVFTVYRQMKVAAKAKAPQAALAMG